MQPDQYHWFWINTNCNVGANESLVPESTSQLFALMHICPGRSALLPLKPTRAPDQLQCVILG